MIVTCWFQRAFNALCHSTHLYGRRLVLEWADTAETVEDLRRKTADHFYDGRLRFSPSLYWPRVRTSVSSSFSIYQG